jgi:hypothetical protein
MLGLENKEMDKNVKVVAKNAAGEEVTCFVRRPTSKDYRDAKIYANGVVASIVKQFDSDGKPLFIVRSQLGEIRKKAGIWSNDDSKRLVEITKEIDELELKLVKGGIKISEGRQLCFKIEDLRSEQMNLIGKMNSIDDSTVESIAENSEFDFLVSRCSLNESGEQIFSSVDEYKENAEIEPYYFNLAKELQSMIYGINEIEEITKERVEYKFLQKFGFLNEKGELVDKEGHLVNREGKRIDAQGYLVNDEGKRVDREGNPLDEKGNRIIEFGEYLED